MVKYLPELAWDNIEVKKTKSYKTDSADYQLKVSFKNTGKLPTALKQAHLVKIVTDDRVVLDFNKPAVVAEKPGYKILNLEKGQTPRERLYRGGFYLERSCRRKIGNKDFAGYSGRSCNDCYFHYQTL